MSPGERRFEVETPDGAMEVFLARPDAAGPHPAVVVYGDNAGVREELRDLARELAACGVAAALPDYYYREGVRREPPLSSADRRAIEPARRALLAAKMAVDAQALWSALETLPELDASRIGAFGCCIGSGLALTALATLGPRVHAVALVDPCERSDRPGTPLSFERAAGARLLALLPSSLPGPYANTLLAPVAAAGVAIERASLGGPHGYCFESWPGAVFDPAARAEAIARAGSFLSA